MTEFQLCPKGIAVGRSIPGNKRAAGVDVACGGNKKKSHRGLEPRISCSGGRRLIHWANGTVSQCLVTLARVELTLEL